MERAGDKVGYPVKARLRMNEAPELGLESGSYLSGGLVGGGVQQRKRQMDSYGRYEEFTPSTQLPKRHQVQGFNYGMRKYRAVEGRREQPLRQLSVDLVSFYERVNTNYYASLTQQNVQLSTSQTFAEVPQASGFVDVTPSYTNKHYDYILHPGEIIAGRFLIDSKLGKGSFGQVMSAFDQLEQKHVAIKVIENKKGFMLQAQTEIKLLREILINDPFDRFNIVKFVDEFTHRGHQCIVCEKLAINLYDVLKKSQFPGLSLNVVKSLGRDILKGLRFLSQLGIIHCDLKPENIMLINSNQTQIKIIDVGSSCKLNNRMYTYIQSRYYRAPEVILETTYSEKIDIWSFGCILIELHTGAPLFPGSSEQEQILRFVRLLGMPPSNLLDKATWTTPGNTKVYSFFSRRYPTNEWVLNINPQHHVMIADFPDSIPRVLGLNNGSKVYARRCREPGHAPQDYRYFIDLVMLSLEFEQESRITAEQALTHPFFGPISVPQMVGGKYLEM